MRRHCTFVMALSCLLAASCQTLPRPGVARETAETPAAARPAAAEFRPAYRAAGIQMFDGNYPNLFTAASTAVWVDQEMSQLMRADFVAGGAPVDPMLDMTASVVGQNLIAIECHIESMMADSSIAYDAVRLHGINVYLLTPEGMPIAPAQVIIGTPVVEEQVGTLRKYSRTNILIFPRRNVMLGGPAIPPGTPAVRLVLQGYGSEFAFEWPGLGAGNASDVRDGLKAVRRNFGEFFGTLQDILHVFD